MTDAPASSDTMLVDLTKVSLVDLDIAQDTALAHCLTKLREELEGGLPIVAGFNSML
jgi:FXSXX-COOH protein